jgi:hypothetical protein
MRMIASRELAARSDHFMEELETEGVLVITAEGKPRSILLPTTEATLMEDLRDCLYARARRSLKKAQMKALDTGRDKLSLTDIDDEIGATRATRHR